MAAAIQHSIRTVARGALLCAFAAIAFGSPVGAQTAPGGPPRALPSAMPGTLPMTPAPPTIAPPAPTPAAPVPGQSSAAPVLIPQASPGQRIIGFTGQLLDVRNGYAYFTTGDAFKLLSAYRLIDAASGAPTNIPPETKMYARVTFDPANGSIVEMAISKKKLAGDPRFADSPVHQYAIQASAPVTAAELAPTSGRAPTGRPVAVTFFVQVPPNTPISDAVYIATDYSGWVPNAMRMDRVDALHYRLTRSYASGTKFAYRYTRGSWQSEERGEDGLEPLPHTFFAREVDARRVDDVVYHWSDDQGSAPNAGPNAIPTPFNPNPFGGQGLPSRVPQPNHSVPPH